MKEKLLNVLLLSFSFLVIFGDIDHSQISTITVLIAFSEVPYRYPNIVGNNIFSVFLLLYFTSIPSVCPHKHTRRQKQEQTEGPRRFALRELNQGKRPRLTLLVGLVTPVLRQKEKKRHGKRKESGVGVEGGVKERITHIYADESWCDRPDPALH